MKFIAADILLLIMGVLLLGAAGLGLAATGGLSSVTAQGSSSGLFNVTFATMQQDGESKPAASFASGNAEFQIQQQNISVMRFNVACNDPAPNNSPAYTVNVNVEGPNGITKSQSFSCTDSTVTVEVPVTRAPTGATVEGDDDVEARKNLQQDPNATRGTGTWRVSWTGSRATVPGPLGAVLGTPSGSVLARIETWSPTFTAITR